jgi:hypothetical protein
MGRPAPAVRRARPRASAAPKRDQTALSRVARDVMRPAHARPRRRPRPPPRRPAHARLRPPPAPGDLGGDAGLRPRLPALPRLRHARSRRGRAQHRGGPPPARHDPRDGDARGGPHWRRPGEAPRPPRARGPRRRARPRHDRHPLGDARDDRRARRRARSGRRRAPRRLPRRARRREPRRLPRRRRELRREPPHPARCPRPRRPHPDQHLRRPPQRALPPRHGRPLRGARRRAVGRLPGGADGARGGLAPDARARGGAPAGGARRPRRDGSLRREDHRRAALPPGAPPAQAARGGAGAPARRRRARRGARAARHHRRGGLRVRVAPRGDLPERLPPPGRGRRAPRRPRRGVPHAPSLHGLRDADALGGKCGACPFRRVCGGSRARAWAMHGDAMAEDPLCAYVPRGYGAPAREQ